MKVIRIILTYLIYSVTSTISGQSHLDLISLGYRFEFQPELLESDSEVDVQDAIFNLTVPIPLKDKDAILFSAQNHRLSLSSANDALLDINSWAVRLGLTYRKQWNTDWYSLFQVTGSIAGNLENGASQSYSGGGLLVLGYQADENIQYKFGLYGAREFFGPFFVPILGIDWKIRPDLRLYGNLPITLNLNYILADKVWTGFGFIGNVASYSVQGNGNTYLEQLSNQVYLYTDLYITQNLVFETRLGYIIGRDYFLFDRADRLGTRVSAFEFNDNRIPITADFKDSPFVEFRIIFRLDLENREK